MVLLDKFLYIYIRISTYMQYHIYYFQKFLMPCTHSTKYSEILKEKLKIAIIDHFGKEVKHLSH